MDRHPKILVALLAVLLALAGCGTDRMGGQGGATLTEPTMFPAESAAGEAASDVEADVEGEDEDQSGDDASRGAAPVVEGGGTPAEQTPTPEE